MPVQNVLPARLSVPEFRRAAPLLFASALFSSAFLLFWIEPLFARMLLPRLGGSQAVWNACLVFFQASLLLGYSYAHLLVRYFGLRVQVAVQTMALAAGCLFLPVAIPADWAPATQGSPVPALFALLLAALGWPFVALSANAPLLQNWFGRSSLSRDGNPFFLYAVSNAGSLLSLVAYPFVIEPALTLSGQSRLWELAYGGLAATILAAGLFACATARGDAAIARLKTVTRTDWRQCIAWLTYAALPSSLLIGLTGYITTDIASFPFLWVLPLCLYLLSYVFAFAAPPPLQHARILHLLPVAIAAAAAGFWVASFSIWAGAAIHLAAFFVISLACHGQLAHTKPDVSRLTGFYFWLSLGGVIGGAATALASPLLFRDFAEYPLALALVCLLRPGAQKGLSGVARSLCAAGAVLVVAQPLATWNELASSILSLLALAGIALLALKRREPLLLALSLFLAVQSERAAVAQHGQLIWRDRSFYGVYTVSEDRRAGYRIMFHGPTLHGVERISANSYEPLTYYARGGPLGDIMRAVGARSHDIGAIGLGIGSAGCYALPGQSWTFYELDGLVEKIARQSGLFQSLPACAPNARIVLGDGRFNLVREGANRYDVLILDAFSSDAIPVHLLTREAFAAYARALRPHGVLAIHITNRHFDLAPVIARAAAGAGLTAYERRFTPPAGADPALLAPSRWMLLAREPGNIGPIATDTNWVRRVADAHSRVWTDDYSNVIGALR